ncbi:MAG: aminoglycoside phosphotransferase family protein [Anaerolineales bacterium]|nr:aminoglycoside phosphotransferase family protein [Anaerolineales bacterium]
MIEKPNISNERIILTLEKNFSIVVVGTEFLPLGLDSSAWAYCVEAENATYFLKLRQEIPNPAGILIPRFLKQQGIRQVMAPLSTKNRGAWASADDFFFILYPFITGERVMDVGMSDAHWVEFGLISKQLHTMKPPAELLRQIKRETFIPKQLAFAKELHLQVKACEYDDPFQKELADFWLENKETIATILERTEALAKRMQETNPEFVLCHADIHTANLLLSDDDKIYIVDWDETMLAPKERDLLFVIGSIFNDTSDGRWGGLFFEGYGETEVDPLALAYYRYDWCVEDIGEFAEDIFSRKNIGAETKANSIRWFKSLFMQGNNVEIALGTRIDL